MEDMGPPAGYGTEQPLAGRTRAERFIERGRGEWINLVDGRSAHSTSKLTPSGQHAIARDQESGESAIERAGYHGAPASYDGAIRVHPLGPRGYKHTTVRFETRPRHPRAPREAYVVFSRPSSNSIKPGKKGFPLRSSSSGSWRLIC
jgi:hypothetical protein